MITRQQNSQFVTLCTFPITTMASFVKTESLTSADAPKINTGQAEDTQTRLPVPTTDQGKKNVEEKEEEEEVEEEDDEEDEDEAEAEAERLCQGKEEEAGKEYLVVVQTYPTNTGCYSGMRWSELDLHRRTDVETHGPFPSYREALVDAIERRNANEVFGDGEAPDDVKEEWATQGPPYCSGSLQNYDEDEEQTIDVIEKTLYEEQAAEQAIKMEALWQKRIAAIDTKKDTKRAKVPSSHNTT